MWTIHCGYMTQVDVCADECVEEWDSVCEWHTFGVVECYTQRLSSVHMPRRQQIRSSPPDRLDQRPAISTAATANTAAISTQRQLHSARYMYISLLIHITTRHALTHCAVISCSVHWSWQLVRVHLAVRCTNFTCRMNFQLPSPFPDEVVELA